MKSNVKIIITIITLLVLISVYPEGYSAFGQEFGIWSQPQHIPGYGKSILTPYLVADRNQIVHAFVSDWLGKSETTKGVFYSRWSLDQGWSYPVDVLLASYGEARVKGAFLDPDGVIHVVYFGGDDIQAGIYYSNVPASSADRSTAWLETVTLGSQAITPDEAAITGDSQGNLYVVFAAYEAGNDLFAVTSRDGGNSWSEPKPIFLTNSRMLWPSHLYMYTDSHASVHVVWSVADISGNGLAVYYAKRSSETSEWTQPLVMAERMGLEADTPTIIEYEDELFLIYHNDSPPTRWMRRSADGGQTWTEPLRLFPHIGTNGAASLVIDSNNILHMFFGNRVPGAPDIHGIWHSIWDGNRWVYPEPVIYGPKQDDYDPSFAQAVVSQGNTILLTWHEDPQAIASQGASYSFAILDAPNIPKEPTLTPTVQPVNESSSNDAQQTQAAQNVGLPADLDGSNGAVNPSDPQASIMFGVFPALVFLVGIIFILWRSRK